jgi:archaellum biogenesis ATPase FlaH
MSNITQALLPKNELGNDPNDNRGDPDYMEKIKLIPTGLARFSLNGASREMRSKMLEDKYILGRIAILGQMTAIYAKPNTGKTVLTLWLLAEAIKTGGICPEDIYYINADDHHKGLTEKTEIAEQYGFLMLAPGYAGYERGEIFTREMLLEIMVEMVTTDTAQGKVIIIDTLKKFVDIMDKGKSTKFTEIGRQFVSKGGSLIMLAHCNKHRDNEGSVIFAGTSDITDDADCYYTLDILEESEDRKTVVFENHKDRGNVDKRAVYTYLNNAPNYSALLQSIKELDEGTVSQIAQHRAINEALIENQPIIDEIKAAIRSGITLKTDLIKIVTGNTCESKKKVSKVLTAHTGNDFRKGQIWFLKIGDKNAHTYSLNHGANYE